VHPAAVRADRWYDPEVAPAEWAKVAAELEPGMRDGDDGDSSATG
jgi:hypothetical protein